MNILTVRREDLIRRRLWANRIIFIGKGFILLAVLFLAYLLWNVRAGYFSSSDIKMKTGQKIIPFELIPGYSVSFASNNLFSKILVLDNSSTQQRIVLNRVYFRRERKPEGFAAKFDHPGKIVKLRKSTFTGIENPMILKYDVFKGWSQDIPYALVETKTNRGMKRGGIYCLYCPKHDKSYFIESSAPVGIYSQADVEEFIRHLGTCEL